MQFFTGSLAKQVGLRFEFTLPLREDMRGKTSHNIIGEEGIP